MWYRDNVGGRTLSDRGHVLADGDGRDRDLSGAGRDADQAGLGDACRLPGYDVDVVDKQGKSVPPGAGGYLVIRKPWPSMARTIHGDPERFKKQYFSEFPGGIYFTGDGARKDEDGYIWCLGRVDDVLNVSGHRLGTMEIESALVSHPKVAEAAVVGRPDDLKGQAVVAFVTLKADASKAAVATGRSSMRSRESCRLMSSRRSARSRGRTTCVSRTGYPRPARARSCAGFCASSRSSGQVKGDVTTLEDLNVIASLQVDEE